MNSFQKAYIEWSLALRDCTCYAHRYVKKSVKQRGRSKPLTTYELLDVPDALVCERERLWRHYVYIRDLYLEKEKKLYKLNSP